MICGLPLGLGQHCPIEQETLLSNTLKQAHLECLAYATSGLICSYNFSIPILGYNSIINILRTLLWT